MTRRPGVIEVIKLGNKLKSKIMGCVDNREGYIDPKAVEAADAMITEACMSCDTKIEALLTEISSSWKNMKDTKDKVKQGEMIQEILLAHEIKDVAAMCKQGGTAYFAESLRDYVEKADLNFKAQIVIIQAHIDVMRVAQKTGLKDTASEKADELKAIVKKAIEQHS